MTSDQREEIEAIVRRIVAEEVQRGTLAILAAVEPGAGEPEQP